MSFGVEGLAPAGISAVLSRIGAIQSRFGSAVPMSGPTVLPQDTTAASVTSDSTALDSTGVDFTAALQSAQGQLPGVDLTMALQGQTPLPSQSTAAGAGTAGGTASGGDVVADAKRYLGIPYVWGGSNPATGLDCSGLVQQVYRDLGVALPRVSSDQARAGRAVASLADAKPGDLVAFGTPVDHIGIYVGDGRMIEAPHTGARVRIAPLPGDPVAIRRVLADAPAVAVQAAGTSTGATASSRGYGPLFSAAETRYGLPNGLLAAVAKVESSQRADAVSPAGAIGLMQLMPATAASLGVDPRDPAQAIDGAGRLLARHLRDFSSLPLALAAYNAGPGAVSRYGGIPPYPETQNYVTSVLAELKGSTT